MLRQVTLPFDKSLVFRREWVVFDQIRQRLRFLTDDWLRPIDVPTSGTSEEDGEEQEQDEEDDDILPTAVPRRKQHSRESPPLRCRGQLLVIFKGHRRTHVVVKTLAQKKLIKSVRVVRGLKSPWLLRGLLCTS